MEQNFPKSVNVAAEPKLWPSERIPQGGIFHAPKIEYSKETAELLKLLMNESKMTMLMRKQIGYHLRNGQPLPKPEPPRSNISRNFDKQAAEILQRAHKAKRKSLMEIKASGAYDIPVYRPKPDDKLPSEKAKKLLQESMSGLRLSETTFRNTHTRKVRREIKSTKEDLIDELLQQINERAEWLSEMEDLGEGKRYRDEIREQIAQRLRHIKALETKTKLQNEGYRYID